MPAPNYPSSPSQITACLARASPDVASLSWLLVNLLCIGFSLHVALYDLWTDTRETKGGPDESSNTAGDSYYDYVDDDATEDIVVSESGRATLEYLVWCLVTTIIWIVEVALRTAFVSTTAAETPTILPIQQNNQKGLSTAKVTDNKECFEDEFRTQKMQQQQQQQETSHQWRPKRGWLVLELLLAIFFFVESVTSCMQWKAVVQEDDVLGEEVDVWISILAYLHMTYETYKAARRKIQARLDDPTSATSMTQTSRLPKESTASYINMATIPEHDRKVATGNKYDAII